MKTFIKRFVTPQAPATLLKRESNTGIFLWILRILYIQKQPPEVLYNKGVLRNLAKFTGKQLCHSLIFNKETLAQVFSCEFCEISGNNFLHVTRLVATSKYLNLWILTPILKTSTTDCFHKLSIYLICRSINLSSYPYRAWFVLVANSVSNKNSHPSFPKLRFKTLSSIKASVIQNQVLNF